ncbi:SDR family NAD(P)-dependent oxidoreductase [Limnohabitans sp.]|uniref:SDR family NAD(P)-dependent oxidoreductase n=1 Tax=Limnohabitans sp. TaxID=1907725 RepID=UPI0033404CD5
MNTTQQLHVIVTGASSGVGLYATEALIQQGWHVVIACRDLQKAARVASELQLNPTQFSIMKLGLGSLQSVRKFVKVYQSKGFALQLGIRLWDLSNKLVGVAN